METKYIVIGIILIIAIAVAAYFAVTAISGTKEESAQPPAFPEAGMSADVLKIFEKSESVGVPPKLP